MPSYINPGEMEEVFWWADYSDGSFLSKYEPDVDGRWISHSFHEIDQRRVRVIQIMKREPGGVIFRPVFAFPFHPKLMKLILFYRTEIEVDQDGVEKGRNRWLYFGFQVTVENRAYKVLWATDGTTVKVGEDRRKGLPLTPGG